MLPRLNLITAVWGRWHTDAFLHACLPSLFAAGNLPALTRGFACRYRIVTDQASATTICESRHYRRLCDLAAVDLIVLGAEEFSGSTLEAAVANQARLWLQQIERSRAERARVLFVWPDVVTADGSLRSIGDGFQAGHSVIYIKPVRVIDETFRAAIARLTEPDGTLSIAPRSLVRLMIEHMHPLTGHHMLESRHHAFHCENLLQCVGSDGFLMRVLQSDSVAFDPCEAQVDGLMGTVSEMAPLILSDSDQFVQASLSPLCKDVDWYMLPNQFRPSTVALFLGSHDTPVTDTLSGTDFVFHCGAHQDQRWEDAARKLSDAVADALPRREIVRVARALDGRDQHSLTRASMAAAIFGSVGRIGLGHAGPLTIFVPADTAMRLLPGAFLHALLSGESRDAWTMFVSEHVVPKALDLDRDVDAALRVETLSGRPMTLHRVNSSVKINGLDLDNDGIDVQGGNRIYLLGADKAFPAIGEASLPSTIC